MKFLFPGVLTMLLAVVSSAANNFSNALFVGLWESNTDFYRTSAPGAKIAFKISGGTLSVDMEGSSYWQVIIDGKATQKILISDRKSYNIVENLPAGNYLVELVHCSESLPGESKIYGLKLSKDFSFEPLKPSSRKIEFIGDSYTVGYGVEAPNPETGTVEETTNTTKSYAYIVASKLKADYRISAFSGRGLVHNYAGIEPNWHIPELLEYTVPGMASASKGGEKRDFSAWQPSVVVVFVGINDFQGEGPKASEDAFIKAYRDLLAKYRKTSPGVKFLLVATKVYPEDLLIPAVEKVFLAEKNAGFKDLEMEIVYSENTALHGHPNERSQQDMAQKLLPKIARLGGFLSR